VNRPPADRSHLSIGEVLSLLQDEFPDVTISKIRFLESQGLLDPERTPSGYRKFYDADIERLRWILRQQKDHYLPLKVIKDRLDEHAGQDGLPPSVPTAPARPTLPGLVDDHGAPGDAVVRNGTGRAGVAVDERPGDTGTGPGPRLAPAARHDRSPPAGAGAGAERPPAPPAGGPAPGGRPAAGRGDATRPASSPRPGPAPQQARPTVAGPVPAPGGTELTPPDPPPTAAALRAAIPPAPVPADAARRGAEPRAGVSLTIEELAEASGMSVRDLRELEGFGLLESHVVGDAAYYDGDALVVARTAGGFLRHGIEARHLRSYKVAVDREAGLFEQIVLPLLKQRNPEAHRRASQIMAELIHLGEAMRGTLLHHELRDHIDPR
jgi:DNA-binding transcriptional MerR regulator